LLKNSSENKEERQSVYWSSDRDGVTRPTEYECNW